MYDWGATGTISDVVVQGASTAGTLIVASGDGAPQIGPGAHLSGGTYGVFSSGSTKPVVIGSDVDETTISATTGPCIEEDNSDPNSGMTVASSPGYRHVILSNCGAAAITIDTSGAGAMVDSVLITGGAADGIFVTGDSRSQIQFSTIQGVAGDGIKLRYNAYVVINDVQVSGSGGDGLDCADTTTTYLYSSSLVGNGGNGLYASDSCFASVSVPQNGSGVTQLDATSQMNGLSGICAIMTSQVVLGNVQLSCAYDGVGCAGQQPPIYVPTIVTGSSTCAAGVDVTTDTGVTVDTSTVWCCD
jgi:hypothetical protein